MMKERLEVTKLSDQRIAQRTVMRKIALSGYQTGMSTNTDLNIASK